MADTLEKIVAWAETLPAWQSDAVRRLLLQKDFGKADEDELYLMLKESNGLGDPDNPAAKPKPVKRGAISGAKQSQAKVTLKAVQDIRNVNALPHDTSLPLGHEGLTVIYGENASGKSGYARVFKRACKARDTRERIHPNILKKGPYKPATATFKLSVNGGPDQFVHWQDGKDSPDELSNISVFDSKCARVIVDENNQVTYLPYGAHVFQALTALLDRFRETLKKEQPWPEPLQYPDIPLTTKAGRFLADLPQRSDLNKAGDWTDPDVKKLQVLTKRIAGAEADNPQKHARRLRNLQKRLLLLVEAIRGIDSMLSYPKEKELKKMLKELLVAKETFGIVSQEFDGLKSELLPGFGETAWQTLYEAAKEYSVRYAYPEEEFPYVGEDSQCVLCQQILGEDAKKRMQKFNAFMEQSAKKRVESIGDKLRGMLEEIDNLDFTVLQQYKDVVDELRDDHPSAIQELESFFPTMEARAKELKQAYSENKWTAITTVATTPAEKLVRISDALESEAQQIEKAGDPEELMKLKTDIAELQARKHLIERMPQIRDYIAQKAKAAKFDVCIKQTDSASITNSGKRIISEVLTPQLLTAFKKELDDLGADRCPLTWRTSGQKGKTQYRLELPDSKIRTIPLGEILSEGEHGVVAIAGFLAELSIGQHHCPIVFDDPVSSLDHRYREKTSERLVREAFVRQVIVFTHDMAFLLDLQTKAGEFGAEDFGQAPFGAVKFTALSVRQRGNVPGVVEENLPWKAKTLGACTEELKKDLISFKNTYKTNPGDYNRQAGELYARLRDTWETFVEEILFNKTVVRFGNDVKTLRLEQVIVNTDDTVSVCLAMTKCSKWMTGHSKAKALDQNKPSPSEIKTDINRLIDFREEIKAKQKGAKAEYKQRLEPESTEIG